MQTNNKDLLLLKTIQSVLPHQSFLFGEAKLVHLIDKHEIKTDEAPELYGGEATDLGSLVELLTAVIEFGTAYLAYKTVDSEAVEAIIKKLLTEHSEAITEKTIEEFKNELDKRNTKNHN